MLSFASTNHSDNEEQALHLGRRERKDQARSGRSHGQRACCCLQCCMTFRARVVSSIVCWLFECSQTSDREGCTRITHAPARSIHYKGQPLCSISFYSTHINGLYGTRPNLDFTVSHIKDSACSIRRRLVLQQGLARLV